MLQLFFCSREGLVDGKHTQNIAANEGNRNCENKISEGMEVV